MRPLFLEFKGLNSFSEKTQIDFEPLLKSGIFGIFGETGSGKSTILDAINFALFGDIGRSAVKTDKINDKCDSLEVKFTFDIFSEGKRRKYYVERSIKRKSGTHKAMLYELDGNGENGGKCLADNVKTVDTCIVDIIGITEEDFKKCIALPQGEFSKFVKSAPSERTELIERLFSLQKYGENLKGKLLRRKQEKENEYNVLTGKLYNYEGVTRDKLKELEGEELKLKEDEILLKKQADDAAAAYAAQKKLLEDKNAYISAADKFNSLKEKSGYYEKMGKVLSVLPDCVTASNLADEIKSLDKQIAVLIKEEDDVKRSSEELKNKRLLLADKISKSDYEGEYAKLNSLYGKMSVLLSDADKLKRKADDLALCRKKYQNKQKELEGIDKSLSANSQKLAAAQKKLASAPEPDLQQYFGTQFKNGILKDEYAKSLGYIKDLQDGVNFFADDSALYDYISAELKRKAEEYKELILSVRDAKTDVYGQVDVLNEKLKAHRTAENEVNKYISEIEKDEQKRDTVLKSLEETLAEGEGLKREYSELSEKLSDVFGDKTNYSVEAERVRKSAQAVKDKQKADEEELKNIDGAISSYAVKFASLEQAVKSANESLAQAKNSLADSLKRTGCADVDGCRLLIKEYGGYTEALEKYNKFTADYAAAEAEAARCEKLYGGSSITEEQVADSEKKKITAERNYSALSQALAVKQSDIKNFKTRLEQKKELDKELSRLNGERDLISQLDKLLRDNKFMKYIANEHLENISKTASKTLLDLTDGRYFLEYEDNNFCVGDNYNGGNRRRVNTLSGGETFLVSLSLALALSDTICRRSLKSIEFFFLDEGFGTLDGDLIDTVLDALEKLKSADFTIGLISHVDELKHRINSKILVSKATESHGSSVQISC